MKLDGVTSKAVNGEEVIVKRRTKWKPNWRDPRVEIAMRMMRYAVTPWPAIVADG